MRPPVRTEREIRKFESQVLDCIGLDWLDSRSSKARSRVIRLIQLLKEADRLSAELRKFGDTPYGSLLNDPNYLTTVRDYERSLGEINQILAGYVGTRSFYVNNGYTLKPAFVESRFRKLFDNMDESGSFGWTGQEESYLTETKMINYSLDLAERGTIGRLRTCRECHKWFYAMTDHQTNCTQACRKQFASHDLRFKKHRREYMKKYRREQRERDKRRHQILRRAK
jgi:hypothetical protein